MSAILPDIRDLARQKWGEHNPHLSSKTDLRFGTNGSKSVQVADRTWFDHEEGTGGGYADLHEAVLGVRPADVSIAATYDYHDERATLLYQVVRKVPKKFVQRRPDGNGEWLWNLHGVKRVPYRLPDLLRAAPDATVYVCEGEKDADALRERMLIATTNAGGAGKWEASFATYFRNRRVVIIPDNDEAGESHALDVQAKMSGVCNSISILRLPDLPPKGDVSDWLAAGGTAELLEEMVAANKPAPVSSALSETRGDEGPQPSEETLRRRKVLTVLTPAQCATESGRGYVIKGLVAPGDHSQVIGLPGAGKSLLAPMAGYCIALGVPFFGRRVRQGRVLYFAPEDGHGMKQRTRALMARYGDAPDFLLVPDSIDLLSDDTGDISRLVALVNDYQPAVVFVDTIARAFPGLRENDSDAMARVVSTHRTITQLSCRPAVIGLHHVAKDAGTTPRGHGVLNGDLDAVLLVEGERADSRTVRLGKNRNGPSDACFSFTIETEDFGFDEDGDPVTAPVAVASDRAEPGLKSEVEAKLRDKPKLMLRELRDLIGQCGEQGQPGEGYPSVLWISRSLLRLRLIDRGWFDDSLLHKSKAGETELTRSGYSAENNALSTLKAKGLASFNRNKTWLL